MAGGTLPNHGKADGGSLYKPVADINVYNPRLGTSVQQSGSGTSIALDVPDEVLIVEVIP